MKHVFEAAKHPGTGELGWKMRGHPEFDPLGGLAVAHDTLEHFKDRDGPVEVRIAGTRIYPLELEQ